jgi:hypothetical protein
MVSSEWSNMSSHALACKYRLNRLLVETLRRESTIVLAYSAINHIVRSLTSNGRNGGSTAVGSRPEID